MKLDIIVNIMHSSGPASLTVHEFLKWLSTSALQILESLKVTRV